MTGDEYQQMTYIFQSVLHWLNNVRGHFLIVILLCLTTRSVFNARCILKNEHLRILFFSANAIVIDFRCNTTNEGIQI
jgi:hypothetical protein